MDDVVKVLASIDAKWVGAALAAMFLSLIKPLGPIIAAVMTRAFKRNVKEIEQLGERELEEVAAAAKFAVQARDAELDQLREVLVEKQLELDTLERAHARDQLLIKALEDKVLKLEMDAAARHVERRTDKHRMPPQEPQPRSRALDDQLDTDRPRSASRELPAPERIPPGRIPSPRIPPPVTPGRGPGRRERP